MYATWKNYQFITDMGTRSDRLIISSADSNFQWMSTPAKANPMNAEGYWNKDGSLNVYQGEVVGATAFVKFGARPVLFMEASSWVLGMI